MSERMGTGGCSRSRVGAPHDGSDGPGQHTAGIGNRLSRAPGNVLVRPNQRPLQAADAGGGRLQVLEGPNAGASVGLGAGTVDIGSDPECGLKLHESGGAVGGIHARVWLQGRRLMLHHVARRRQTYVGDKTVEWAMLDPHDTIRIGPHVIAFAFQDAPSPS